MLDYISWLELVKQNPTIAIHLVGAALLLIAFLYVLLFLSDGENGPPV